MIPKLNTQKKARHNPTFFFFMIFTGNQIIRSGRGRTVSRAGGKGNGEGDKNACGELGDGGVVVWDTALLRGNLGWGERARDFQFFKS